MKQFFFIFSLLTVTATSLSAQKFFTRSGQISFSSETPLEKIHAANDKATCVIDTETGNMEFAVLIKAFSFEKALMQEHFNENYMESGKFPKATFKGAIRNKEEVNFNKSGIYNATIAGDLTIHGVTQPIEIRGAFTVKGDSISANSEFKVLTEDYEISIPAIVRENIAKEIMISVSVDLQPLQTR